MTDCPECGVPFDEIPPKMCVTHRDYYKNIPHVFEEDFVTLLDKESDDDQDTCKTQS